MDEYASQPKDKNELLSWIEKEWDLLLQAIDSIDEAQMSTPGEGGWSIKDHLAHLAEWESYLVLNHLQRKTPQDVLGIPEEQISQMNEDEINQVLFMRHHDQAAQEIIAMLQESHSQVLAELAGWDFEGLLQPRWEDDEQKQPVGLFVAGNTYFHYREHRETIEKLKDG